MVIKVSFYVFFLPQTTAGALLDSIFIISAEMIAKSTAVEIV